MATDRLSPREMRDILKVAREECRVMSLQFLNPTKASAS